MKHKLRRLNCGYGIVIAIGKIRYEPISLCLANIVPSLTLDALKFRRASRRMNIVEIDL